MKKFYLLLVTITLSFVFNSAKSQCINGFKSYPIYQRGAKLVEKFDEEGAEIVRIEYDLIFTTKESLRTLNSDWEYVLIGFADDGVKKLSMALYEYDKLLDKWQFLSEDAEREDYTMIIHKPKATTSYKIEIKVAQFEPGYNAARYGLMIVHE